MSDLLATKQQAVGRPNILFILSDQHNPFVLGCEGDPWVRTPNLDRLAAEGVVFSNCYCQNPLCVPSRASLITGQYCRSIGIYENRHIMEANSITFPRVLAAAGYRTCLIGKAHFNGEQFHGYQQRPYGDLYGQAHQPDPRRTPDKGESGLGGLLTQPGPSGIPLPLAQTEICVAEAAKWLQAYLALSERPFCLSVHFDKPHFPMNPPPELFRYYEGKIPLPQVPEGHLERAVPFVRHAVRVNGAIEHFGRHRHLHERALAAYYGCVEWVDNAVGRLLDVLGYLGLAENTIVIYTSDHGEMAAYHGYWQKTVFFDRSARVPLIIRWPKWFPAGRRQDMVGLLDLFPTMCEAAGIPIPEQCEGVSLTPLLRADGTIGRNAIFSESVVLKVPEHAGCMIRTGPWKYNLYLDGAQELYNLEEDPGEWHNLAANPELAPEVTALRQRVEEFWRPEEQLSRYGKTPLMAREKHFYQFSNQFMLGDGTVVDARP